MVFTVPGNPTPTQPVPAAIFAATPDPATRLAMLLGSGLEGGYGPTYGAGDNGNSRGPYQINLPYHPDISAAAAVDPTAATAYMLPAYQHAETLVPSALYTSNPEQWAEEVAALAEHPAFKTTQANAYYDQGRNVDAAYAAAVNVLGGVGGGNPASSTSGANDAATAGAGMSQGQPATLVSSTSGGGSSWESGDLFHFQPIPFGPTLSMSKSFGVRLVMGFVGIVILFIAINALAHSHDGDGPVTVLANGTKGEPAPTGEPTNPPHHRAEGAAEEVGEVAA